MTQMGTLRYSHVAGQHFQSVMNFVELSELAAPESGIELLCEVGRSPVAFQAIH